MRSSVSGRETNSGVGEDAATRRAVVTSRKGDTTTLRVDVGSGKGSDHSKPSGSSSAVVKPAGAARVTSASVACNDISCLARLSLSGLVVSVGSSSRKRTRGVVAMCASSLEPSCSSSTSTVSQDRSKVRFRLRQTSRCDVLPVVPVKRSAQIFGWKSLSVRGAVTSRTHCSANVRIRR